MNQFYKKEEREEVCAQICRVFYNNLLSFNVVKDPEWIKMTGMIGNFRKGFKSPSYHEVRVKSLKLEVERTMNLLSEFKEEWKRTGCTIMSDGWTDKKKRSICNFLVNSPKGTRSFLPQSILLTFLRQPTKYLKCSMILLRK